MTLSHLHIDTIDADIPNLVIDIKVHLLLVAIVRSFKEILVRGRRGKNRLVILQGLALPHDENVRPVNSDRPAFYRITVCNPVINRFLRQP